MIAQLSDFHVRGGADPDRSVPALEAAVQAVLRLQPLPDAVLVTGDLADGGTAGEYALVRERLTALPMPVHVLPGNHDDPAALRTAFGLPSVRYSVQCGPLRLVACDTSVAGSDAGRLGDEQLAWIEAELAEDRETPTIVAMHHPPILTGIDAADEVGLPPADRLGLEAVLERHPHVRRVVCGHVHRAVAGGLGGCGVFVCPSTNIQLGLDLRRGAEIKLVPEPPSIAVHALVAGELATHMQVTGYRGQAAPTD